MKVLIENILSVNEMDLQQKPDYILEERWEKITRIRPVEDKKRSFLAGRLLHQMCGSYGIKDPVYGTVKNGKPVFINYPQIVFSISHSGEYVVVAHTEDVVAVGVDIQQIKNMSNGLKRRLLHEKEFIWLEEKMSALQSEKSAEEMIYLNRIWAVKESYVKMTGEGMAHDFRKLYVDLDKKIVTAENGRSVSFIEPEVPEGYALAVVVEE